MTGERKRSGNPRFCNPDGHDKPIVVPADQFDIRRFNCVVTMYNTNKRTHRTFMARTVQKGERFGNPGDRLLCMLTGPDRSDPANWKNIGFISERGIYIFKNLFGDKFYRIVADMLTHPSAWEPKGVEFLMMTFCRRCNKPLTRPDSLYRGLGEICAGKVA